MNKSELISKVAQKSGLRNKDAALAVNGLIEAVTEALVDGDSVQLVGFGTFDTAHRAQREGRNVQTGEKITIPEKRVARFRPGKSLKEKVNV